MNYNALSTWRCQNVKLKQGVNQVDFLDTKPNMFLIQNPNPNKIRLGISRLPTAQNFEYSIGKNDTITAGQPLPVSQIYFFLDANIEIEIKVWSIYQPFDLGSVNTPTITLDNATIETDGIIKGFAPNVSIPHGDNKIGSVEIENESFKPLVEALKSQGDAEDEQWKKLMNKDIIADIVNLRSIINSLSDIGKTMTHLVDGFLKVTSSKSVTGAVITDGHTSYTYNTNNWCDCWKEYSNQCLKVSDFDSDGIECEIEATASYDGILEQKKIIGYFTLSVGVNDKIKLYMRNTVEGYPERTIYLESINDANNEKYVRTNEVFNALVDWLWLIYPPTYIHYESFKGINFKTTQNTHTFTSEKSQVFNTYSGAFRNVPKMISEVSEFNGIYTLDNAVGINICSPLHSESVPIKIMDKVEMISNLSDTKTIIIKLFYTFEDYVKIKLPPNDYISDLPMPIYNIDVQIVDYVNGDKAEVSVYGGMY